MFRFSETGIGDQVVLEYLYSSHIVCLDSPVKYLRQCLDVASHMVNASKVEGNVQFFISSMPF